MVPVEIWPRREAFDQYPETQGMRGHAGPGACTRAGLIGTWVGTRRARCMQLQSTGQERGREEAEGAMVKGKARR